jgi:hypothetical protein
MAVDYFAMGQWRRTESERGGIRLSSRGNHKERIIFSSLGGDITRGQPYCPTERAFGHWRHHGLKTAHWLLLLVLRCDRHLAPIYSHH